MERISNQSELIRLKQEHPEWSFYDPTMRIKRAFFEEPVAPSLAVLEIIETWRSARSVFQAPLVQVRTILPLAKENILLEELAERKTEIPENAKAKVIGRIPFALGSERYGIYYLQIESDNRKSFTNGKSMGHEDAVNLGYEKRVKYQERSNNGFTFRALDFSQGKTIDILSGENLYVDVQDLVQQIVSTHKSAFIYPHDPAQQTIEGITDIVTNNPTILAFDEAGRVSSVCLFERESRFTFGKVALVEPTYFTRPEVEGKGLSSYLRQIVKKVVESEYSIPSYNNDPIIVFTESIRHTTFPLCIGNSHNLAGSADSPIDGNLGEAYTAIGPANPEIGYMPMGLTYLTSPSVKIY